jgi:hypothetical protein
LLDPILFDYKKKGYDNEELEGVYYGQGLVLKRQIKVREAKENIKEANRFARLATIRFQFDYKNKNLDREKNWRK